MITLRKLTLIELIVVLAVLAILAAMLFPSLTGYIDKAADDKLVSKARSLYNASQATVSSHYAINPSFEKTTSYFEDSGMNDEIISLSEVKGEFECFIALDSVYRVTELFYTENNKSVYFQDGSFQVSENISRSPNTNIAIKGSGLHVPGREFSEAIRTGRVNDPQSVKILSMVEEMQIEAIKRYKQEGSPKGLGYFISYDSQGNLHMSDISFTDKQSFHQRDAAGIIREYGYFIAVSGNKVGTNLRINEENKVVAVPYHILVTQWRNDYDGLDMKEYE